MRPVWGNTPFMVFEKNKRAPLSSKFRAYVSIGKQSYRISMRAGSGTGINSECVRNKGYLPDGVYDPTDKDSGSTLRFIANKRTGSSVVRGPVWQLGSKKCKPKAKERRITRTELYIHSQGASGWSGNYASNGCIKINQGDRAHLAKRWKAARNRDKGGLVVY